MDNLLPEFTENGNSKLIETFVKHRSADGISDPVYKDLSQRYLIVKLDYTATEVRTYSF